MNTTKNGYANHLVENDFLTYVIESHHHLNLGDRVKVKGMELVVAESIATMKQGILTYSYLLTLEEGIRQEPIYPAFLAGAALEGKIIDVHKTMVRVHLAIDEEQSKEEATWFPCHSLYTGEGHTGFYCMPEIGDTVHLFFLNSKEEEAVVYRGWRKSGKTNSKTSNPAIKYWGTLHRKEIKFSTNDMVVTAKEGSIFLKLHEEEGIELHSEQALACQSEKNLSFSSRQNLTIQAEESIFFTCDSSSLVMDGITDIQGSQVEMRGSVKAPVSVANEEEGIDEFQLGLDVTGMIPISGGGYDG